MGAEESSPELGPADSRVLLNDLHRINVTAQGMYRRVRRPKPPASIRQMRKVMCVISVLRDSVEVVEKEGLFYVRWRVVSKEQGTVALRCAALDRVNETFGVEKSAHVTLQSTYGFSADELLICSNSPIELKAQSLSHCPDLSQITIISIDSSLHPKVLCQKVRLSDAEYIAYEIFGAEKRLTESEDCVVCLSQPRTTAVLPCRHMCLCTSCGDLFRVQAACKCPMCRACTFHTVIESLVEVPSE